MPPPSPDTSGTSESIPRVLKPAVITNRASRATRQAGRRVPTLCRRRPGRQGGGPGAPTFSPPPPADRPIMRPGERAPEWREEDGRPAARLPGEKRHPAQRPDDPLLRVARTPAPSGLAAPVLRVRAHVGVDGQRPGVALPHLRPRPAGPRRQRAARRRLLGGGVRARPAPVLPGGGDRPGHRRRPVPRWAGRAGVRGDPPGADPGPRPGRRAAHQQLLPDARGSDQGAGLLAPDARSRRPSFRPGRRRWNICDPAAPATGRRPGAIG